MIQYCDCYCLRDSKLDIDRQWTKMDLTGCRDSRHLHLGQAEQIGRRKIRCKSGQVTSKDRRSRPDHRILPISQMSNLHVHRSSPMRAQAQGLSPLQVRSDLPRVAFMIETKHLPKSSNPCRGHCTCPLAATVIDRQQVSRRVMPRRPISKSQAQFPRAPFRH